MVVTKKNSKARQVNIDNNETSDKEDYGSPEANTWVRKGQTLSKEEKVDIVHQTWEAQTGMMVGPNADF